jgi:hypothetical protein
MGWATRNLLMFNFFVYLFIRDLFNVTFSWYDYVLYSVEWLATDELESSWNELVVT